MAATVILFLAANPITTSRLALDEEVREIEQELRMSQFRDDFVVRSLWAPRPLDLLRGLNEAHPAIVHFAGHGIPSRGIILPDDDGGQIAIDGDALRQLFERFPHTVRLVVLNACFSQDQCEDVKDAIGCAIGMSAEIQDAAARRFAGAFYGALGAGCSVKSAFDQAVTLLDIYAGARNEPSRHVALRDPVPAAPPVRPVLRCRSEVDPDRISFVSAGVGATPSLDSDVASVVRAARLALASVDERERDSALKLLASTDGAEARTALVEALGHPAKAVRIAAARLFPDRSDPRILRRLIEGLADDKRINTYQWSEVFGPFLAAVRAAGAAAVPELIAALDDTTALPPRLIEDLARALGSTGDARAVPALVALTRHVAPEVRYTAVDNLARLGAAETAPELRALLEDSSERVRVQTALCLGQLGDRGALARLRELLRTDVRTVRRAAADALSLLRDADAVPDLHASLTDPDADVRLAAAKALLAVDDPAGSKHLRALLTAGEGTNEISPQDASAILALIPAGDPGLIAIVERRIASFRTGTLPPELFQALAALGSAGHAALIRILDQAEPSSTASRCAAETLSRIESPEATDALTRWRLRQ